MSAEFLQTPISHNSFTCSGRLTERKAMRYTPAGVAVSEFRLVHVSEQVEAGAARKVECEIACVALGAPAQLLQEAEMDCEMTVTGFLAARSKTSRQLALHVTAIEFN